MDGTFVSILCSGADDICWNASRCTAQLAAPGADTPMGWNSWDSYGLTITEDQFKANVAWFNQHLKQYGWQYVVIDEGWYLQHPENAATKGADRGAIRWTRTDAISPRLIAIPPVQTMRGSS